MKDVFRKFYRSSWRNSIVISPPIVILWLFFGWLFTLSLFDEHYKTYRLLTSRSDALSYIALLFAVQIPLFILLLERIADSGYIRRLILPGVIRFREVLVSYVLLSCTLLLSSRASYYYFPVITLTILSLYTVFIAVRVLFEQRKLKKKENNLVREIIDRVFKDSLAHRVESNNFLEKVKNTSRVTHAFFDTTSWQKNIKKLEIRTKKAGLVSSIDVESLEELMTQHFSTVGSSSSEEEPADKTMIIAKVVLAVRPGANVKNQDTLMRLIIPDNMEPPEESFINRLRRSIKIEGDTADSPNKQLDDLITDFKQQLRDAIDKDSVVSIQQALEFYQILLDGLTTLSEAVADSGYTFTNARQEFRQFMGDSVSRQITSISDILNDELQHAIREERADTTKELINFIYHELLNVLHDYDTLRAAFADFSFTFAISRLIFDEPRKAQQSAFRDEIFDYLAFRLKEHTGLLLYNYRGDDNDSTVSRPELELWLKTRLNDLRGFLQGSYRKSNPKFFSAILKVFQEFEQDHRLYEDEVKDITELARCSLFVLAAYMHDRPDESAAQKESRTQVDTMLRNLSVYDLTNLLVKCIDEDYADKWRVDTYDLVADGQMHSVPDFGAKLKSLWATYMMQKGGFSTDSSHYNSIPINTTFTFSDGLSKAEDAYLIKHLNGLIEKDKPNAQELKQLVLAFIAARKQWEDDKLISTKLSRKKVSDFRKEANEGYVERAIAESIFNKANKLQSVRKADNSYLVFGWNQVVEKAAFIDDWHAGYYMQPKERGSEIASRENEIVAERLLSKHVETRDIKDWLSHIQKSPNDRWVIFNIETGSWYIRSHFEAYIEKDKPYNDIYFKDIKQFKSSEHMYHDKLPKGLYAVRVRDLGVLNVKPVNNKPVEVLIDAYSHNQKLLKAIVDESPEWLKKRGNKAEQEKFLKTMVRMLVHHVFKYEPAANAKVYYLPLDDSYSV